MRKDFDSQVIFDKENHIYTLGGKILPSVTTIIKNAGLIKGAAFFGKEAANKGTLIHEATEIMDTFGCDVEHFDHWMQAKLYAWEMFLLDHNPEFVAVEQIVHHEQLDYAGTIDRIAVIDGKTYVIDIKTGGKSKWHYTQVVAYKMALESQGEHIDGAALVYLKDHTYKFDAVPTTHIRQEEIFFRSLCTQCRHIV